MNWRPLLAACAVGAMLWLAAIFAASAALSATVREPSGGVSLARLAAMQEAPVIVLAKACGPEDSRAWTWSRCGNRRRGVVRVDGRRQVVTCGGFRSLAKSRQLDRRATPVLRGDWRCGR